MFWVLFGVREGIYQSTDDGKLYTQQGPEKNTNTQKPNNQQ